MKIGDLVKWINYRPEIPEEHVGVIVATGQNMGWGDLKVLSKRGTEFWTSWQCEVINENR